MISLILAFLGAIFNIAMMTLFSIPVVIILIVSIIWQSTRQKKKQTEKLQQIKDYEESLLYCRNCGNRIKNGTNICSSCGVKAGTGNSYCYRCGSRTDPLAIVCVNCGVSLVAYKELSAKKSKVAAGCLGLLFGTLGIHNFYLGYTIKAVGQLLLTVFSLFTGFGLGLVLVIIWGVIESIMIFTGGISTDANGAPLK